MKFLNFVLPLTFFVGSSALAQDLPLLDYRTSIYNRQPPTIPAKTEKWVLSKVVQKSDRACSGELTPDVIDAISGSFTTSETKQTAYLVDLGDSCNPQLFGTKRLAVFERDRLIASGEVQYIVHGIKQTIDVDQDDRQEVILQGGSLGQGYLGIYAEIVSFSTKGISILKEFSRVYANNFGTIDPQLWQEASVIKVNRKEDGQLDFQRENYAANCTRVDSARRDPTCEPYKLVSTGDPEIR
jgi:hypothetical protein